MRRPALVGPALLLVGGCVPANYQYPSWPYPPGGYSPFQPGFVGQPAPPPVQYQSAPAQPARPYGEPAPAAMWGPPVNDAPAITARPIPRDGAAEGLDPADPAYGQRMAACLFYKGEANNFLGLKHGGAPFEEIVDYATKQSARQAIGLDPISATDNEKMLLHLAGAVYYGEQIYASYPGGVLQLAYDQCMRGKQF